MKTHHWILVGVAGAIILFGSGYFVGRQSKHCEVCPDYSKVINDLEVASESWKSVARSAREERDKIKAEMKAAEEGRKPINDAVNDRYGNIRGLRLDTLLDVHSADPI